MTDVAVVIPAFNPGDRLRRSVQSLLTQTLSNWEAVVVDDGGDEDLSWIEGLDSRIRLIRQINAGVSVARNVGVAQSSARWLAFLDQDDEWLPDKLSRQLASAESGIDFVHTGFVWCTPQGETSDLGSASLSYLGKLSGEDYICLSSIMVTREAFHAVGGFDPMLLVQQDFDLMLRLAVRPGFRSTVVPDVLVRYYVHDDNASRDYVTLHAEAERIFADHERRSAGDATVREHLAMARKVNNRSAAGMAIQAFRSDRQAKHFLRAALWHPSSVVVAIAASMRPRLGLHSQKSQAT